MKIEKTVPIRTCIACRSKLEKDNLVRVVKNKAGEIYLDKTFKADGRGAYLCDNEACIIKCCKSKALSRTFKQNIETIVYDKLLEDYIGKK